jgi:hypothetical protein
MMNMALPERNRPAGITLIEILAGMFILALAFIPVVGVISTGSADTDVTNSYVFAQTTARNVLDTLLDNVPFDAIRVAPALVADIGDTNGESNVGQLFTLSGPNQPAFDVASYLALLGNPGGDTFARGELVDERGIRYKIKLFVFPIPSFTPPDWDNELCFRYLPRPHYENATDSLNRNIWYTEDNTGAYVRPAVNRPYDLPLPPVRLMSARQLGAQPGPANDFCVMKRILLRIRWQMNKGPERSLEIFTAKANLAHRDFL